MRKVQDSPSPTGLIGRLLACVFPSRCPTCDGATDSVGHAPFCMACWGGLRPFAGPRCLICGVPFTSAEAHTCAACLADPPPYTRAMGYGLYEGVLAAAVHHFKFNGVRRLHRPLGGLLLSLDIPGADVVVPVPLSLGGLRARGFNQSLLLARYVSEKTGMSLVIDGLVKVKETPPQVGLSARERTANLRGAFRSERDFSGRKVVLVDDVMTTGATVAACARQLRKSGAEDVTVITVARAGNP